MTNSKKAIARELRKSKKGRSRLAVEFWMEWRSQQHRKHNVVAPWSTKTLYRVMERICSVGMNQECSSRLVGTIGNSQRC
ncbi:hypothetical protein [Microcoleus anatoxicus]|uniref:Uncharacterized protein n=1 Tax=Microcoleus anatoxicus PTRS2 TaxID=2705321 RepID=A0ABU8YUY1_9CYAN